MTLAERPPEINLSDETAAPLPLELGLLPIRSLLRLIERTRRDRDLQKIENIKQALGRFSVAEQDLYASPAAEAHELLMKTGNLLAEQTVVRKREEARRIAKVQYENKVFPAGVSSKSAARTAPTFRLTANEGELEVVELDPLTLEPLTLGA